jgi:hypothetical protein
VIVGDPGGPLLSAKRALDRKVENGIGHTARFAKDALVKKTEQTFYNGYTGLGPTKTATGLAWAGAAGYAAYGSLQAKATPRVSSTELQQGADVMSGDGMGYSSQSANSMNASGSLVFGLNAMRRG